MTHVIFTSSTTLPFIAPPSSVQYAVEGSSSRSLAMRSVTLEVPANNSLLRKSGRADDWLRPLIGVIEKKKMDNHNCLTLMNDIVHSTLKANLIGTELMGRISLLKKKARESEKSIHEAEEIARGAQLEAANWKEQFENAQRGLTSELAVAKASSSQFEKDKERLECSFSEQLSNCSEEIRELKVLLAKKEEYAGELVQSLTQAQADLKISSDKVRTLESSHASLEASFESSLAENQVLKNDLAMWEREYELLEENFNIEVSWAFLNSHRDALIEASQENFDLNSELAKVLETIEKTQQPLDFPFPLIEAPVAEEPLNEEAVAMAVEVENVAIPASEGETSMTQSVEVEASVTPASLVDPNISSSAETVPVAASSEVATVPVAESEINIATSDVLELYQCSYLLQR
ncbi:HDA1 complex subunit 2-like [Nicotiana sylvestris]|uniref:HDA1 complex subunit 2-like n=1 Tax=Nicotiana sylvestris TaxID=4096 RepID=UPI00388C692B